MANRWMHLASRATPLATCVAAVLGLTLQHEAVAATTHYVTDCGDSGSGTLRNIVNDAGTVSGDTIDFSNVAPCTVTLKTGAINVTQASLTIQAPAGNRVSINGKYNGTTENDRLVNHTGTGTLSFSYINFYNGSLTSASAVKGGCIYSKGSVQLISGTMTLCGAHATGVGAQAKGGAIYAAKQITMKYADVLGAGATSDNSGAYGGALVGATGVGIKYSTVSLNQVNGAPGSGAFGGGIFSGGNLAIRNSTISGNSTSFSSGGVLQAPGSTYAHIYSSTISGNTSSAYVGGLLLQAPTLIITNSTIAFNASPTTSGIQGSFASGLAIYAAANPTTLTLQSSIISNNYMTTTSDFDFSFTTGFGAGTFQFDPSSSNNLVRAAAAIMPADTKFGCPRLAGLRDNGGRTQTHALSGKSIAIDSGSNPKNYTTDQRGDAALYPRVSGTGPDIGAYEVNQDDSIFSDVFESCNPLPI